MDQTLLWTMIGAIGSSAGSFIGVIALIVAIKAYVLPTKKKVSASLSLGTIMNEAGSFDVFSIQVTNNSVRPITIGSIGLSYCENTLFLDMLPVGTILQVFEPKFPVRLEQGSYTTFYLPREKFILEMTRQFGSKEKLHNERLYIKVGDESQAGIKIKTKFKINDFLRT